VAGYRALSAVGYSLVSFLNQLIAELLPRTSHQMVPRVVLVQAIDYDKVDSSPTAVIAPPAIAVHCYRISLDQESGSGWSARENSLPAGVSIRMHVLITAWAASAEEELLYLGCILGALARNSVLTGDRLHPSGDWEQGDSIQVRPDDAAFDSIMDVMKSLNTEYKICLPYVVGGIRVTDG
jgi:Pvc16 N-terminal domain